MLPMGMKVTGVLGHGKDLRHVVTHSGSTPYHYIYYIEKETEARSTKAGSSGHRARSSYFHNSLLICVNAPYIEVWHRKCISRSSTIHSTGCCEISIS